MVAATASLAVLALLQGVDGVACKKMVDLWAVASREEQAAAFRVAESVRWIEIGLTSTFRIINGATLLLFALAIVVGAGFPRWVWGFGWVGVATGLAWIVGDVAVG